MTDRPATALVDLDQYFTTPATTAERDAWQAEVFKRHASESRDNLLRRLSRAKGKLIPAVDQAAFNTFLNFTGLGDHPGYIDAVLVDPSAARNVFRRWLAFLAKQKQPTVSWEIAMSEKSDSEMAAEHALYNERRAGQLGNKRYRWVGNGIVDDEAAFTTEMEIRRTALSLAVQMWSSTGLSYPGEVAADNYLSYTTKMADVFVEYIRGGKRYSVAVKKPEKEQKA